MKLDALQYSTASLLLLGLAACGGGGGSSTPPAPTGPVASTLSFPLRSAYANTIASGYTKSISVAGTCNGSGIRTNSPATTAAVFEGLAALSAASTLNITFTNCTPSIVQTTTGYYSSNYVPVGTSSGVNYGVYLTPLLVPSAVTVGSTGVVGTLTLYTDITKAVGAGRQDLSYLIEPDTSSTAVVNLIGKVYNATGTLLLTSQDRYLITATGGLTIISSDLQYANGSTTHLIISYI